VLRRQKPQQPDVSQEDIREKERLEALDSLEILDAPRDEYFDRTVGLIKSIFGVPIALVSVIDAHRQVYKACEGLAADEYERKESFCAYTILETKPMVVPDTAKDPRFAGHTLVVGEPRLRFYAGVPLRTRDGHNIGTICAIDTKPRKFAARDVEVLENLAQLTMDYIELRQMATFDPLTGVMSRRAFTAASLRAFALAERHKHNLSLIVLDIDHFKSINDTYGHAAGDEVLSEAAAVCAKSLRSTDLFGRIGGEEFAVLLPHTDRAGALEVAEKLRKIIAALPFEPDGEQRQVTASFGVATLDITTTDFDSMMVRADGALYRAKAEGRNRCVAWRGLGQQDRPPRRRVLKAGLIHFNHRRPPMECTVHTLSEDGAGLEMSRASGLPETFKLSIRSDRFDAQCHIVSQTEKHIEVEFI
jgi:diguanylate cyclase (GGDEF)-like protein